MSKLHPCTGREPAFEQDGGLLVCIACGAYQRLNPESGNVTWVRAGRVISAPQDMLEASQRHEMNYGFGIESAGSAVPEKDDADASSG